MKTTKRILVLLICNLLLLGTAFAERVSEDDAALVANNFMNVSKVSSPKKPSRIRRVTPKTSTSTQQQYYIFENADGEGWVMVAANDAAHPIIAYSDEGQFRFENQPENVKHWLGKYDKQIKYADDNNIQATDEVKQEWKQLREGIAPKKGTPVVAALIKTKWDQDEPYWNLCPMKGSTHDCYTGCVATAMAQVMYYWKWPVKGTGSYSYTTETLKLSASADFGNTTYDWDNMLLKYNGYYPEGSSSWTTSGVSSGTTAQKNAVATLMYHCGVAAEMDYNVASAGGSGAYTIFPYKSSTTTRCAQYALVQNFGYNSSTIKGYYRPGGRGYSAVSDANWHNLLKTELDAARPIMYAGADDEGGHSFICDGYDDTTPTRKYHFNWGWSGYCDGYYDIDNLVPGIGGSGAGNGSYNDNQDIIIGIMPPELGHTIKLTGTGCSLSADKQRVENGNSVTVTITPTDATYDYTSTTVKLGSTTISSSNYTLSSDKKTLTINGSAITGDASNDLTITVVWTKNRYKYEMLGENCTAELSGTLAKNAALNLTITPASGYTLADAECWDVEMGGNKLTYGTGFTYNSGTGAFSIASVTGDVAILAYGGHQVKWYANGNLHATNMSLNDKITLPDNPADCSGSGGKKFVGWCTSSSYSSSTTAPTFAKTGDAYSVDKYYAVYANGSGSGGSSTPGSKTFSFSSIASANSWENGVAYTTVEDSPVTLFAIGGGNNGKYYTSDNSWRMYKGGTVNISVASGSVTSVTSSPSQTFTIEEGVATLSCTATIKFTSITVNYTVGGGSGSGSYTDYSTTCTLCTLTGITLNTDGVTKTFTQGDAFSAEGLVVTASYSNCSSRTISPTSISTPDMSTIGEKTITVTYTENEVTKTATYKINVNAAPTYAIRFFNMGTQVGSTQNVIQGQAANKPANPSACDGYDFVGWWTAELGESNTESKTWITDFTATKDQDYYAAYTHTETSGSGGSSTPGSKTFSFSSIASANSWENGVAYTTVEDSPVTLSAIGGGNNGKWYTSSNGSWRMYSGGTVQITVDGGSVTSVTSSPSCTFSIEEGVATFSPTSRTDFTSITVNYTVGGGSGSSTTYYTTEPNCVVCTNKVNITKGTAEYGSFSIDKEGENDNCKAGGLVVTVSGITPDEDYMFSEIIQTGIESGVTIDQNAKTVTYAKDVTGSSTINVVFVHKPTYTIRFYNNGALIGTAQTVTEGKSANKPANPSACDGYDFVGWWTAELGESNTDSKTWITDFTATKDQDYYAAYSHTETSGSGGSSTPGSKTFSFSSIASANSWENGVAYTTVEDSPVTLSAIGGGNNGKYYTSDNSWRMYNGGTVNISVASGSVTSVTSSPSQTFTIEEGVATLSCTATIRFTSITVNYTVGGGSGSSTTYYTTEPNCVACTNKVNITKGTAEFGSFSIDKEGENDNCKAGGLVVTVSGITPNEDYMFSEITQTGIESGVTIDQNAKTVTYAKDVTGTSTINVVFVHKPTYTIRFYNNGALIGTAQTVTEGKSANKPANPSACDGYDFVGWWTAELGESNTESKTWITDFTATKDQDYYAAYSHTETSGSGGSSTPGSKTFSFSSIASANSWENGVAYTTVEDSPVTINALGDGNNGKWYTSSNGSWRMYSGGTVQITVDGGSVTSVTSSPSCTFSIEEGVATFSPSARTDFTSITVNYTVGGGSGSSTTYYTTEPDCCTEVVAPTVNVTAKSTSATISWNNQVNATNGYSIVVKQGTTVVFEKNDIAAGATSYTVTGLLATTEYNYTVVAKGSTCNASASGNFSTTDCEDVPHSIVATTTVSTARISWTAEAATATIRVYEDKTCNNELTEKAKVGVSSPATIEGLEEHTTYYLKIWANGNCVSAVDSFTTLTTSVEIAEWFTDSIRIVLTSDDSVKVIIEDKQEQTTVTENYADSLFISKYFEATSNTKLIAVFNGTNHTIHLDDYSIAMDQGSGFKQTRFDAMKYKEESSTKYFDSEQLTLESGKEIILISYPDASAADAAIIDCAMKNANSGFDRYYRLTTPSLQFNGDDAIGLVNPEGQLIDLIGAGTLAGGVDNSAIEATSQSGSEGGSFHGFMDKPGGWYTEKGYHKEDGNTETNNYALSTNRCLLIRRNHVKSGLDAVERNKTDFLTLGDYTYETVNYEGEWKGIQIPGPGCSDGNCAGVTAACEGFDDVGSYDYNEYYAQFDSISADTIGGTPNEDGTYTVEIPGLDTLACSTLRISVYDRTGTVQKFTYDYKVPIMIHSGEIKTQNELFTDHDIATCKECDVVVMDNATLTKETGDRNEIRNLILYPGSSFNLPADAGDYTVQSLQFRVEGENAPITKLSGNLIAKDGLVTVTRRINNDDSYFFSLPYDCNISDIHWSTGEPMVLDQGVRIKEYDSESRAKEGSGNGKPSHWKMVTGDKLYAGKGYQISVNTKYYRELVFPMVVGGGETNLTEKEDDKTSNVVNIKKYEPTDPSATTKNNWNWNFIAQPYIGAMIPSEGDNIKAGWLKYTEPENPGDAGTWEYEDGGNEYLTLWNPATSTYDQTIYNKSGLKLDPFVAFFVQGKAEGTFTFEKGNRILSAPARHLAAKAENEDLSIFVGVTLSGNGQSDETTVRIRPDFTNEYELGYDLEKFLVFYTARPQIYMKPTDSRLAFQAINDETATNSFLPVGVYCYEAGTYTFGLSKDYPTDEIEAVYLYDKTTDVTTNLLYDTYSITTTQQLYTNTRFSLNVIVNRKSTGETTGFDATNAPDGVTRKIINNGHVYIQRSGMIYDVMGKQILNSK